MNKMQQLQAQIEHDQNEVTADQQALSFTLGGAHATASTVVGGAHIEDGQGGIVELTFDVLGTVGSGGLIDWLIAMTTPV